MSKSDPPDPSGPAWRRSHTAGSGNCVEVAFGVDSVLIRHSSDPNEPTLTLSRPEWNRFLQGVNYSRSVAEGDLASSNRTAPLRTRDLVAAASAQLAARLGARLAGRKRINLREAWLADLAHASEIGNLTVSIALRMTIGYLICAVRLRAKDLRDLRAVGWRALRYVVTSHFRTHIVIFLILGVWIGKIFIDQGVDGVTSDLGNFGLLWTGLGVGANRLRARLPDSKDLKGPSSSESDNGRFPDSHAA